MPDLRLGINIDHIATVRNARGGTHPDPIRAALLAQEAGADGITAHLREDRRHIRDADMRALIDQIAIPLNMEMAATDEMVKIALEIAPHAVCLVPEKREELTTEGGLDVVSAKASLAPAIKTLADAGSRVSLFVDADLKQLDVAKALGAAVVELHTGRYCETRGAEQAAELARLREAARHAAAIGLECHAGHGLCYETVGPVAAIPEVVELNIGHFLMGEAMFIGLKPAIHQMRRLMDEARA
ncbi:MAG: pyridoxine 5'-phosphate synthase [Rickettsiales bacterium]